KKKKKRSQQKDEKEKAKEKEKQKEKEKEKEKEIKKPKQQLAPAEDLLSDITVISKPQTGTILSDDWLDDFATYNKDGANNIGEDGGKFGFADWDDDDNLFPDEEQPTNETKQDDDSNSDAWMTQLTKLDNPLQPLEKPQKKIDKKGKTMSQMQSKQNIDLTSFSIFVYLKSNSAFTLFHSNCCLYSLSIAKFDHEFLQTINTGLNGQSAPLQNTQPLPTGLVYPVQPSVVYVPSGINPTPVQAAPADPFLGLGVSQFNSSNNNNNNNGPIPATYQKPQARDPFDRITKCQLLNIFVPTPKNIKFKTLLCVFVCILIMNPWDTSLIENLFEKFDKFNNKKMSCFLLLLGFIDFRLVSIKIVEQHKK
ncbi:hypothetical protein RFI_00433, partial [Reticulomyxa filosa]